MVTGAAAICQLAGGLLPKSFLGLILFQEGHGYSWALCWLSWYAQVGWSEQPSSPRAQRRTSLEMRLGRNVQEEIIIPLLWINRDFSLSCCQTGLLQQRHENTLSYKEIYVILLNGDLPPWTQLVCWFSKGEDDFPPKQN